MTFAQKVNACRIGSRWKGCFRSSVLFCLKEAIRCFRDGKDDYSESWLEKAASHAFGVFHRPKGW